MRPYSPPSSDAGRSSCGDVSGRRRDEALSHQPHGRTIRQRHDDVAILDDTVIKELEELHNK